MKPTLDEQDITVYASDAQTIQEPYGTDYTQGVRVGRTIPAKWWNWLFKATTTRLHQAYVDLTNLFTELTNLLTDAQITPSASDNTQIEQAVTVKANEQIAKYMENKQGFPTHWDEAIVNLGVLEYAHREYNIYNVVVDDITFSLLWSRINNAWYKQILIASKLDDKPVVVINSDFGVPSTSPMPGLGYRILTPFKDKIIVNTLYNMNIFDRFARNGQYIDKNDLSIHDLPIPSTRPGFRCLCSAVVEDTLYMIGCDTNAPDAQTFMVPIMYRTTDLITFTECTVASGTLDAWWNWSESNKFLFSVSNNDYGMLQIAQPPIYDNGRYYIGTMYIQNNALYCIDSTSNTIRPSTSSSPMEKLPNGDIAIWPYFILHTADDTTDAVTLTSSETLTRPAGSNRIFKYNRDTYQESHTDDGTNWTVHQGYILGFDGKYYYTKSSRTLDLQTFEDITEFFPEEVAEWLSYATITLQVVKGLAAVFEIHHNTGSGSGWINEIYAVTTDKLENPAMWFHIEQPTETDKVRAALADARSLSDNRIVCKASIDMSQTSESGWPVVIWNRYRSYISVNRVYNNTLYLR
jgi:hypothetical protein